MNPAPNLFLIGPMGAGKTTIGRRIAEQLHLPFHDLDHVIEEQTGATIPLIFELEGEPGFRRRECAALEQMSALQGERLRAFTGEEVGKWAALVRQSGAQVD